MILARLNNLHDLVNANDVIWSITNADGHSLYRTRTACGLRQALAAMGVDPEPIRDLPDFDGWLRHGAPDMPIEPADDNPNQTAPGGTGHETELPNEP